MPRKLVTLTCLALFILPLGALGCSSTPSAASSSAEQPTPSATLELPGAAGTPMVTLDKERARSYGFDDLFVTAEKGLFGSTKTLPPVFPTGVKTLFLVVKLKAGARSNVTLSKKVNGRNGPVDLSIFSGSSKSSTSGGTTVTFDLAPTSGSFADGPYEAILVMNGKEIAKVNWTVGSPE